MCSLIVNFSLYVREPIKHTKTRPHLFIWELTSVRSSVESLLCEGMQNKVVVYTNTQAQTFEEAGILMMDSWTHSKLTMAHDRC
jgi:hypothetical protein